MKLLKDTSLIFSRSLQITLRQPLMIIFRVFQPVCLLVLFAPLLEKLVGNPSFGSGSALAIYTPGVLIMMAMFGGAFAGMGLPNEIRSGVIERFQVTPLSRSALLLGKSMCGMLALIIQITFLVVLAWILGLSAPWFGVMLSYGLVILVGFSMSLASHSAAMILKNEEALSTSALFLTFPLQLLSGISLPLSMAPAWLQKIAFFNPFAHAVSGIRALFLGDYSNMSILWAYILMLLVASIAFFFASYVFEKTTE
jgi:ABC-2 type transport system permease protein